MKFSKFFNSPLLNLIIILSKLQNLIYPHLASICSYSLFSLLPIKKNSKNLVFELLTLLTMLAQPQNFSPPTIKHFLKILDFPAAPLSPDSDQAAQLYIFSSCFNLLLLTLLTHTNKNILNS